jgi:hypothetical protein
MEQVLQHPLVLEFHSYVVAVVFPQPGICHPGYDEVCDMTYPSVEFCVLTLLFTVVALRTVFILFLYVLGEFVWTSKNWYRIIHDAELLAFDMMMRFLTLPIRAILSIEWGLLGMALSYCRMSILRYLHIKPSKSVSLEWEVTGRVYINGQMCDKVKTKDNQVMYIPVEQVAVAPGRATESAQINSTLLSADRHKSVIRILNKDTQEIGVGFRISVGGGKRRAYDFLVTAKHLVDGASILELSATADGSESYDLDITSRASCYRGFRDIMVLKVPANAWSLLKVRSLKPAYEMPESGRCELWGYDWNNRFWNRSTGDFWFDVHDSKYRHTASTLKGMSGSPLICCDVVVGVHVEGATHYVPENRAEPLFIIASSLFETVNTESDGKKSRAALLLEKTLCFQCGNSVKKCCCESEDEEFFLFGEDPDEDYSLEYRGRSTLAALGGIYDREEREAPLGRRARAGRRVRLVPGPFSTKSKAQPAPTTAVSQPSSNHKHWDDYGPSDDDLDNFPNLEDYNHESGKIELDAVEDSVAGDLTVVGTDMPRQARNVKIVTDSLGNTFRVSVVNCVACNETVPYGAHRKHQCSKKKPLDSRVPPHLRLEKPPESSNPFKPPHPLRVMSTLEDLTLDFAPKRPKVSTLRPSENCAVLFAKAFDKKTLKEVWEKGPSLISEGNMGNLTSKDSLPEICSSALGGKPVHFWGKKIQLKSGRQTLLSPIFLLCLTLHGTNSAEGGSTAQLRVSTVLRLETKYSDKLKNFLVKEAKCPSCQGFLISNPQGLVLTQKEPVSSSKSVEDPLPNPSPKGSGKP